MFIYINIQIYTTHENYTACVYIIDIETIHYTEYIYEKCLAEFEHTYGYVCTVYVRKVLAQFII